MLSLGWASEAAVFRSISYLSFLSNAKDLSPLLSSKEGDDGVRTHSEIVSWETSPESSDTFSGKRFREAVNDVLVGHDSVRASLLLLHLCLDVVEWERSHGGSDSSNHR